MRIYFDMCSLQRPLDDQTQLRVLVEAQAVLGVLSLCESGQIELIASDALVFESEANPDAVRRDFAVQALAKAHHFVTTTAQIKAVAQTFIAAGLTPLDALHLASAMAVPADYFCTCDDRLLKKARLLDTASTKVVSPLELVSELQP
jgi:predicted nucleic acid-binding protein